MKENRCRSAPLPPHNGHPRPLSSVHKVVVAARLDVPQSRALSIRKLFKIGLSTKGFSTYHYDLTDKVNQLKQFI